jgi:hypothetical protein
MPGSNHWSPIQEVTSPGAAAMKRAGEKCHRGLEVPVRGRNASEYLDLLCLGPAGRTAIEFKYVTRQWSGTAGTPPEEYALRGHNAPDVARRDFLRDVARLERFCDREDQNGLALLITNEAALWRPRQRRMPTRDEEFRIHHGRELSGTLLWAGGSFPDNTRVLRGAYMLTWRPYTQLEDSRGVVPLPRGVHHSEPSAAPAAARGVTSRLPRMSLTTGTAMGEGMGPPISGPSDLDLTLFTSVNRVRRSR